MAFHPHNLLMKRKPSAEKTCTQFLPNAFYSIFSGHCQDANTGAPPRGLQFTLGTKNRPEMFDTIVMANLVGWCFPSFLLVFNASS